MDKSKIAIITTVINWDLYNKSSQLFPANLQKYVIDGSNGMFGIDSIYYMMKILKNKGIEWLIMADEDVLFINTDSIYSIIETMITNDYIVSGVRDGGQIGNRTYSPYLINTFFSILNFKELELIWDEREISQNQYILENEFDENLLTLNQNFDVMSLYEPYYRFYFWLRRKGKKILFLDAKMPFVDDNKTTLVYDNLGQEMLYNTWYSRSYGNNENHTKRIDKIFNLLNFQNSFIPKPILFKDQFFYTIKKTKKLVKRINLKFQTIFKK